MKTLKQNIKFNMARIKAKTYKLKQVAKIVEFKPKSNLLTDSDIESLFLGLVNLVKQNAYSKAENQYKKEINYYMTEVKDYALKVIKLENEVRRLNKQKI